MPPARAETSTRDELVVEEEEPAPLRRKARVIAGSLRELGDDDDDIEVATEEERRHVARSKSAG